MEAGTYFASCGVCDPDDNPKDVSNQTFQLDDSRDIYQLYRLRPLFQQNQQIRVVFFANNMNPYPVKSVSVSSQERINLKLEWAQLFVQIQNIGNLGSSHFPHKSAVFLLWNTMEAEKCNYRRHVLMVSTEFRLRLKLMHFVWDSIGLGYSMRIPSIPSSYKRWLRNGMF